MTNSLRLSVLESLLNSVEFLSLFAFNKRLPLSVLVVDVFRLLTFQFVLLLFVIDKHLPELLAFQEDFLLFVHAFQHRYLLVLERLCGRLECLCSNVVNALVVLVLSLLLILPRQHRFSEAAVDPSDDSLQRFPCFRVLHFAAFSVAGLSIVVTLNSFHLALQFSSVSCFFLQPVCLFAVFNLAQIPAVFLHSPNKMFAFHILHFFLAICLDLVITLDFGLFVLAI